MKCHFSRVFVTTVLSIGVGIPDAFAEGVDLQHFRPSVNGQGVFGVESATLLRPKHAYIGVSLHHSDAPLVLQYSGGDQRALVSSQSLVNVQGAMGVLDWLELGFDLPMALSQQGIAPGTGTDLDGAGPGDLRFTARARLLGAARAPISLALVAPLTLPTGSELAYLGEGGPTFNPQVAAGGRADRLGWTVALGYRLRPAVDAVLAPEAAPLTLGNEVTYGAAFDYRVRGPLRLGVELEGALGSTLDGILGADDPLEARFGLAAGEGEGLRFRLGGAVGLSGGYGSPAWRIFSGVSFAFGDTPQVLADADKDGITDPTDQCSLEPEDLDGYLDADGCPDFDNDQDAIPDVSDRCPSVAEVVNGVEDGDGCPDIAPLSEQAVPPNHAVPGVQATGSEPKAASDGAKVKKGARASTPSAKPSATPAAKPSATPAATSVVTFVDAKPASSDAKPTRSSTAIASVPPTALTAVTPTGSSAVADADADGLPDSRDRCPNRAETRNGYEDDDGCPEADTDRDGIVDGIDRCLRNPETINGYQDSDGCPESDVDEDGILDALDRCPKRPEVVNQFEDEDGCPDQAPTAQMLELIKIKTQEARKPR